MRTIVYQILAVLFFLQVFDATAQMPRVIHIPTNNSVASHSTYRPDNTQSCSIDTILLTSQAAINNFATTYPTCTTPKYLLIDGAGASPAITSLSGLSSITQVVNKLEIKNTSVINLTSLNNITSIGDTLHLERNNLMTSIGLTNLSFLGSVIIEHLPALTSVAGLCNNIHKTGLIKIDSTNLSNLTGLHTIDTLTTPNGGLNISFSQITSVAALNNLKYIEGYLRLSNDTLVTNIGLTNIKYFWGFLFDGMPVLNSVAGLTSNLNSGNIGTFWFFNTGLPNLNGLEGITSSANFYISGNNNLLNINGLQNLGGSIGGGISIWGNSLLASIDPLKNITSVNGSAIEVSYNYALTDLGGLKNITDIGTGLWLVGNNALTSLDSLNPNLIIHNNLNYNMQYDSLRIIDNINLAVCANNAICNYLNGGNPNYITNNAVGCNDTTQIHTACNSLSIYNDVEDNCCINNAIALNENQEKYGRVGSYDHVGNFFLDVYDTYKIIVPKSGSIKIFAEAKNDSCDDNTLYADILDKYGDELWQGVQLLDIASVPCHTLLADSVNFGAFEADTFYIRLFSSPNSGDQNEVKYKISYKLMDTSAVDDIEPNNTISNAIFINPLETKKGHIYYKHIANSNFDLQDIYKAYMPGGGNIKAYFKSTFRGKNSFFASIYDLNFTVNNVANAQKAILPNCLQMNYGDVHYDTLSICAIVGDTAYFKIEGGAFEYEFKYEVTNAGLPTNDIEPNNTFATATPIVMNETKQGLIKALQYNALGTLDVVDYYKTLLPKNGKLRVISSGNNISCSPTNISTLAFYNKLGTYIPPSYSNGDTLFYCSTIADTAYFSMQASYALGYTFKYDVVDTFANDIEPNDYIHALLISKNETKKGTIRLLNNIGPDYDDFYKIITTCADTIKLKYKFKNVGCNTASDNFQIQLFSKNLTTLYSTQISNIANGNFGIDSFAYAVNTADTFYVNLYSNYPSSYELSLLNTAPSGSFIITGGDSSCLGTKTYKAENICGTGLTYHWSLSSGGSLTAVDSIATVNWTTPGTHTISLYLSNAFGNSAVKQYVVNVFAPLTLASTITATARTLNTNPAPIGATIQWYKSGVAIIGETNTSYLAADSGTYTVRYKNYCGFSPTSNSIYFALPLQNQTITFNPLTPDAVYAPNAFVIAKATATSNLPVVYSIVSGPATMSLDSVKISGAGTIVIAANQNGNINYNTAPTKYDTIQIFQGTQTITFNTIPNKKYSDTALTLNAISNVGLPISYVVTSGNAIISGNTVTMTGAGNVTIQATQTGNGNYNAATPVSQSFCIGVKELSTIQGEAQPCLGTYKYTTKKIVGANYIWTLSSGGTLTFNNDTATVVWTSAGTHTLAVKANSSCDAVYGTVYSLTINPSNNIPTVVTNMLPANNTIDLQIPFTLSWIPGQNTVNYDLYIWRSDTAQPAIPFATNITGVTYNIPAASLAYNKTYKWRLISKNPCNQTAGPIQQFTTIPLPDLQVLNVQAPTAAFSGQNITINWTVKNNGPGKTTTNQSWQDAVFLSYDSINPFTAPPGTNPGGWAIFQGSNTLLVGIIPNQSALDSGQQYTNTLTYTLPIATSIPVFAYVITNYGYNNILEVTKANDTARAPNKINVTLSPTPDLRVDSVFAPNTTFSGSTLNVTYKVKNYGVNTPAGSFWVDKFYISNSAIFNSNNATELNAPKLNGTYYYNAPETKIENGGILKADSFYTKSQQVVIPNFINGTYFIHVITNQTNTVYEGAATTNNTANKQIQVIITPTPKLEITSLNVAADTLSNTQPFTINYNIVNNGFYDNIEKNKGHFIVNNGPCTYCVPSDNSGAVGICYPSISTRDSLGFGSSNWLDNIYLSTDSTGLNSGNAILLGTVPHPTSALLNNFNNVDLDAILPTVCQSSTIINPASLSVNVANSIKPLGNYPGSANSGIPNSLPSGKYYIYVWANANKGVFEYPANNEIKRSVKPIVIQNPDLTVASVTAPTTAYGGQSITINYTVANLNTSGVFNAFRRDYLYISNSPVFDNTATVLPNTNFYFENVLINNPVTHSFNYTFPTNATGIKYFYVKTNVGDIIMETTYANNVSSAPVTINVVIPPASVTCDLQVTNITVADTTFTKLPTNLQYTVTNTGLGTTQGTWIDSVFVSCSPIFNPATASFVAAKTQTRSIGTSNSYTDVVNFTTNFANDINSCFPNQQFNNAYWFVKTNANNVVIEGANTGNNTTGTTVKTLINPWPDYIVTQVNSTKDTTTVGHPYPVTWTVKNLRYNYGADYFSDAIYFSPDSVFNNNATRSINTKDFYLGLAQNQTYTELFNFTTPNITTGDYYVFAKTNMTNNIYNENITNNTNLLRNANGTAKKIHVIKLPLPDFTDSIIEAPTTIAIGQPLTVKTKITNNGLGANYPANFSNRLWLNTNFSPGGYELGSNNVSKIINAGQSYTDSISLIVPLYIPAGNYILVWHTNNTNSVIETSINNNLAFKYITVTHPTPVDLLVDKITIPDTAYLGYSIDTLKWTIFNNAVNSVIGYSSDGLYLSKSTVLDSTATLLKINQRLLIMNPLQKDTLAIQPVVNNVAEGNYNVMVKTDMLNNIIETDKNNNVGIATKKLFVKVHELKLNILKPDSLNNTVYRYYKLKIPDSLRGATIQVILKTNDSLTRTNQMYIGAGYVPDPAHFDYKYGTPNYGNQDIVMTSVNDSLYYITVRNVNSAVLQTISLKAIKLPFTILNVQANSGGNTGNVTVKISGNLFNNTMIAKLKLGATSITASNIYFVNSTSIYATFNLAAKPLGIYNVELFKTTDSTYATLANGFSIVPANNGGLITGGGINGIPGNGTEPGCDPNAASGLNSQLVTEIVAPDKIFIPFPYEVQINFSNPTNVDIPAQTKILFADNNVQLALSQAGLATGTSSLYISFTEPGGPPGIIRAGASGTIIVYCKAPNNTLGHTILHVTLK